MLNSQKELINDLIIDLKAEGIWDKLDHFYLAALSGKEEQLIDWKNPTETLTDNGYDVTQVPYKGLAPQIGTYYTGIIPSVEMNINSSFYSFKCGIDFNTPNTNYILGADDYYRVAPLIYNNQKYYRAFLFNSFNYNVPLPSGTGYDNTVVINRTASNSSKVFINNQTALSTTTASVSLPTTQIKIGGEIDLRGNSHNNFVQHFACGSGLTDAQGLSLTTLIDNFANTQKALDTDYIEVDGIRTTIYQNAFKCVLGQQCIWNDYQNIYYSTDLGNTISATIALPTEGKYIDSAHIFDNGKIIFSTIENKIYKTTTALTTITEMLPTKNGSPYTIHTPNDSRYPGEYYKGLWMGQNKSYLADGREIKIWGNYCNVFQGASPVLVWYSFGDDIKVAFEFGQNQYVTDNGIAIPITGGTLLGDATQTIKTRHMHSVHQDPNSLNDFYSSMGDYDRTEFYESNIVKHIYDPIGDTFTTSLVVAGSAYSRVKISTLDFISTGELLFASDATSDAA